MQVELVAPDGITYRGEGSMVIVRTVGGGDIAFQSNHAPFIGVLQIHEAKIIKEDGAEMFAVHSGFVQSHGNKVTILSDVSEILSEIDVPRAQAALQRAEAVLQTDPDNEVFVAAKARAETRLRVAGASTTASH